MPTVSVIMGIYNCEKTLSDAIDSIINQTYSDWELIMCDDGSTDNTYQIATKYSEKDNRITVIKNDTNSGLAFSLNHCLKYAKGEYVARMDADDISLPNRFEKQVAFLNKNNDFDVVGSCIQLFDGTNDLNVRKVKEIPEKKDLIKGAPHAHPTIMMRKIVYDKLDGYTVSKRTQRCEDLDMWFRFYSAGYRGYNLQMPLLKYRESLNDYNKRTLKSALTISQTTFIGYKMIKCPFIYYIYIVKPIISALLPNKVMYYYHKKVCK